MSLRLAEHLSFPVDVATQTLLVVGKRGSGKSTTATRLAEQLIGVHVPVSVLDPVDVWWGLKAGADGQREGLPIYVFGGQHAPDLPLEPTAGRLMAQVFVDERINMVLCTRGFTEGEKHRFVSDYADELFKRNREVVHLFCEEAQNYMPQALYEGVQEKVMLNRMIRLWKEGRTSGIGMTAISQRVASVNKNATTQAEILVVHRLLAEQDVDAVDGWIKHHRQQEKRQEVLAALSELKTGEAFVWAPDFPEERPVGLRRLTFLMPETFDSRRTPKVGERVDKPRSLRPVDMERLKTRMAATIEQAKQNDPAALRAEVMRLRQELARGPSAAPVPEPIEVPVLTPQQETLIAETAARIERAVATFADNVRAIQDYSHQTVAELRLVGGKVHRDNRVGYTLTPSRVQRVPPLSPEPGLRPKKGRGLKAGALKMLAALRAYGPLSRQELKAMSGVKGGTFTDYQSLLRTEGWIVEAGHGKVMIPDGAGLPDGLPSAPTTPSEVLSLHRNLKAGALRMFEVLRDAFPNEIERATLSERAAVAGGTFMDYLSLLRRAGLLDDERLRLRPIVMSGVGARRA